MTQPPDPKNPRPLDYAPPMGNKPAGGVPFIGQMAIGFAALFVVPIVSFLIALFLPSALHDSPTLMPYIYAPLTVVLPLIGLATIAWRRWHWRGVLVGMATALGLVLVAWGLCALNPPSFH